MTIAMTLPRIISDRPVDLLGQIVAETAHDHGVRADRITGPARWREVVEARWEVFARLYAEGWSMARIARAMRFDHSSVSHGIRKHRGTA